MAKFNLGQYVTVAERLGKAVDAIATVAVNPPAMLTTSMGFVQVTVTLRDGRQATGTGSFRLDLTGPSAQATSPLEDAETSALGRALAFLGYSSDRRIASREEAAEAERRARAAADLKGAVTQVERKGQWLRLTLDSGAVAVIDGRGVEVGQGEVVALNLTGNVTPSGLPIAELV